MALISWVFVRFASLKNEESEVMTKQVNTQIPISPHFFCDGMGYVLTSSSLGGSNLTPGQISSIVLDGSTDDMIPCC